MLRHIYVAGVDQPRLAKAAESCPYWLLSVGAVRLRDGRCPGWLTSYLESHQILWDPGTFSSRPRARPPTPPEYRRWITDHARPHHRHLSYDEINGDPDLNMAYLKDLRQRGYKPIPVYHRGMPFELLSEPRVAIGGLVRLSDRVRADYLDWLFYGDGRRLPGQVHLLGMGQPRWFQKYPASSGDSTTWIPRFPNGQVKTTIEWMKDYGERNIPFHPPKAIQGRLAL